MGIKISNLPAIVTPAITDVFPVSQSGVTYKENFTQFISLFANVGITTQSITFNTTSGIIGTTTNDNAAAGSVGQTISASVPTSGAGVALTTDTPENITSISLTAGDWDVNGSVIFEITASTNVVRLIGWLNSVSATIPDSSLTTRVEFGALGVVLGTGSPGGFVVPTRRFSLASTTTIYLTVQSTFSADTNTGFGQLFARRVR